jgi:hypothetical protein
MPSEPPDLKAFLEAAGRSLADAQGSLVGGAADIPAMVAISDAELEVKALVETRTDGKLALKPVSSQEALTGKIDPGALSTVKIRYVAVTDDTLSGPAQRPTRSADSVIAEVKRREDVASLGRILGTLKFEATFVPARRRWIVTATDPAGRVVREVLIADAATRAGEKTPPPGRS